MSIHNYITVQALGMTNHIRRTVGHSIVMSMGDKSTMVSNHNYTLCRQIGPPVIIPSNAKTHAICNLLDVLLKTANISKTVNAAARQIEDIEYLRDHYGFKKLPENLRQMAEVRLEYPDAPLKELGGYLDPPVGKSGANHRLRKLSEIADRIRA